MRLYRLGLDRTRIEQARAGGRHVGEAVDQRVGLQIAWRDVAVAEPDQDKGHCGGPGGGGVGRGVADHHGAVGPVLSPPGAHDGGQQVARVGLGRRGEIRADHRPKVRQQIELAEQFEREAGGLVGAYSQPGPVAGKFGESFADAVVRPALLGDPRPIGGDEAVEEIGRAGRLEDDAVGGEAALDENPRAAADQQPGLGQGKRRGALLGQQAVQRPHEVRRGVDQGAVEIEDDAGAGEERGG